MYKHVFKKVTFCFHETKNIFHEFKPYHKSYLFYVRSPVTILYKDCRGQGWLLYSSVGYSCCIAVLSKALLYMFYTHSLLSDISKEL